MKKKIAIICCLALVVVSVLTIFAACNKNNLSDDSLKALRANLYNQYREDKEVQQASYKVLGEITGVDADGKEIKSDVLWTIEGTDKVTVSAKGSDGLYTVVVPDPYTLDADISYTLTATLVNSKGEAYKNSDGDTYSVSFARKVQAESGVKADAVMTLDSTGKATLAEDGSNITWVDGGITLVNYKASSSSTLAVYAKPARFYKSTTVEISYTTAFKAILITLNSSSDSAHATGFDGMEVEGATISRVGDSLLIVLDTPATSFVSGALSNQTRADKVELFINEVPELQEDIRYETEAEILEALKKLKPGETLTGGKYSLTGTIVSIDEAYSSDYNNVTVTIEVGAEKLAIQCFRLDGGEELVVGDEITVTGVLLNYDNGTDEGKLEFNSGCTYVMAGVDPNAAPDHVTDKTVDNLATTAPADMAYIYELTGIWVPTGGDDDTYGAGNLYDVSTGKSIAIYAMAPSEDAFSFEGGKYVFANPKAFQEIISEFVAGDEISVGVAYSSSYKNYYAYFIQKTESVANIKYDLTAVFNDTEGTVTLSQEEGIYNEEVTITIQPASNFKIGTVKHNDVNVNLVDGQYKIKVAVGPNKIEVTFAAADAKVLKDITIDFTVKNGPMWEAAGSTNDTANAKQVVFDSITFSFLNCKKGSSATSEYNYMMMSKDTAYFANEDAIPGAIVSVTIVIPSGSSGNAEYYVALGNAAMLEVQTDGTYQKGAGTVEVTADETDALSFFNISLKPSGSSTYNGQIASIVIEYYE